MAVRIINAAGVARIIAPGGVQRVTEALPVANDNVRIVTFTGGDERSNIQGELDAAEAAGGGIVRLEAGRVYQVNTFVTHNYHSVGRAGVLVGPNVWFDLNGSTLKAGPSTDMWVVANKNPNAGTRQSGIWVYNGEIDSDEANQSRTGTTSTEEYGGILFQNVIDGGWDQLTMRNCTFYGGEVHSCERCFFTRLQAFSGFGDGFRFGIEAQPNDNLFIDEVYVEDMEHQGATYPSGRSPPQGNPLLASGTNFNIGRLSSRNTGGGYKFEFIEDSTIGQVIFDGSVPAGQTDNSSDNSGVKFQGNTDALECRNNTIGQIICLNCQGIALRISEAEHITVNSYFGRGNSTGAGTNEEVRIEAGPHIIGNLQSHDSQGTITVLLDDTTPRPPDLVVGSAMIKNPPAGMDIFESNAANARLMIGQIRVTGGANGIDVIDFNQAGLSRTNSCTIDWGETEGAVFEGTTHDVGFFGNNWT